MDTRAGFAQFILSANNQRKNRSGLYERWRNWNDLRRWARNNVQYHIARNSGKARRSDGIDIASEAKTLFHKSLDARTRSASSSITQAQQDMIPWFQIAIYDINKHGFLEGAFVPFLVKTHL